MPAKGDRPAAGRCRQGPQSGTGTNGPTGSPGRGIAWRLEVRTTAGLMRREPHGEPADVFSRFDRLFDESVRMMPFRPMAFPRRLEAGDLIRVEKYREDGTLVLREPQPRG